MSAIRKPRRPRVGSRLRRFTGVVSELVSAAEDMLDVVDRLDTDDSVSAAEHNRAKRRLRRAIRGIEVLGDK